MTQCKNPKACTILLRGASKDILNEVERNLQDALHVARNVVQDPRLVPGGGAAEMAISHVSSIYKYARTFSTKTICTLLKIILLDSRVFNDFKSRENTF